MERRLLQRGFVAALLVVPIVAGCQRSRGPAAPTEAQMTAAAAYQGESAVFEPVRVDRVNAVAAPPAGWRADPIKASDRHAHQVWLSPSGDTAYGVIYFTMPSITSVFPAPMDWVLDGYLDEMRRDQGEAVLLDKQRDPELPGMRFVAEGGLYKTWTNLITQGRHGWAIYAGALRSKPVAEQELELASEARERTVIQVPGR